MIGSEKEELTAAQQALYLELGDKIWDEVPYDYQGDPEFIHDNTVLDGPAKAFNKDKRLAKTQAQAATRGDETWEAKIGAAPQYSLWWYFGNQAHHVTKALRLEYRVKDPTAPDRDAYDMVTKHILVGFEGVIPGG
jgi:hypothetical protein